METITDFFEELINTFLTHTAGINVKFEDFLNISPDTITGGVLLICILLLFVSLFTRLRDVSPSLMISAGIIGTFWGTFIALADFETGADHEKMVESIPVVLGGMKTAFITSLIGLFMAFSSKIAFHFLPRIQPKPLSVESNTLNLLAQIRTGITGKNDDGTADKNSLSSQLSDLRKEYQEETKKLKQSINGDDDSSIASQLKKLDGHMAGLADAIHNSLVTGMDTLMTKLEDVIAKKLVGQLEATNKLLNDKLTEMLNRIEDALIKQFGETFKQFNAATQAIKKWQEEHKEHVEKLTEAFDTTTKGIEKIRADCAAIPLTMEQLKELMGELDKHLKELDERIIAFAEMKDKAVQSFPIIHENLNTIGANLQKSAEGFNGLEKTISDTYTNSSRLAQEHIENIKTHMNQTADQVKKVSEKMIAETDAASTKHQTEIRGIMNKIIEESQRSRSETETNLKTMRDMYMRDLNEAMEKITRSWGENMVGIAKRMAEVINTNNNRPR